MIKTIFFDMDGVLCDFHGKYKELYGFYPEEIKSKEWKHYWNDFISRDMFSELNWHRGGDLLIETVQLLVENYKEKTGNNVDFKILSSTSNEESFETVSRQKKIWLLNNSIEFDAIFVPGKRFKPDYANNSTLLIDDTVSIIEKFNEAGGHAILHENVDKTVSAVEDILRAS